MKTFLLNITASILLLAGSFSCSTSENAYIPEPPAPNPPASEQSTLLVYMVANNNLGTRRLDEDDIAEMARGMQNVSTHPEYRLLVYHAPATGNPKLLEITHTGTDSVLVHYDNSLSSIAIPRMRQVIADASRLAPAQNKGLVLWSHGTGWLEDAGTYNDPQLSATPLSFGVDGTKKMSVPALAQAIGENAFNFIYFDCCLMGTVEVAYELRKCAPIISASSTELPLEGMPYNVTVPYLLPGNVDAAAKATHAFYSSGQASESSCAIGIYDTKALEPLAAVMKKIMETGTNLPASYTPVPFFRTSVVPTGAFDMADYVRNLPIDASLMQEFNTAYSQAVTGHYATPFSYGLDMSRYTGLGCNIVRTPDDSRLAYGYRNLQWFNDVISHSPIFN